MWEEERIRNMDAGRELDALIAERVMGLEIVHRSWPCGREPECGEYEAALNDTDEYGASWHNRQDIIYKTSEPLDEWRHELGLWCSPVPFYSTDIAAAWAVVEKMRADRWLFQLNDRNGEDALPFWAEFATEVFETGGQAWQASMPHAICLAALQAVGFSVD